MSDHGEVQYATATGNDLPAHEAGYEAFINGTFLFTVAVINALIGLAIGGVSGHWLAGSLVIIAAIIAAVVTAWTGSRTVSYIMLAIAAVTLLLTSY